MTKRGRKKGGNNGKPTNSAIGNILRHQRRVRRLSLGEIGVALGCSEYFISRIESGKAPLPHHSVENLSKLLDIPLDVVLSLSLQDLKVFKKHKEVANRNGYDYHIFVLPRIPE